MSEAETEKVEIQATLAAGMWARLEEVALERGCTPAKVIEDAVAYFFAATEAGRRAIAVTPSPAEDIWASAPRPKHHSSER